MLRTTLGRLMVMNALPVEHRDIARILDKPGIAKLLRQVAEQSPEKYTEVAKSLADIGRRVSTMTGGNSFSLSHLSKSKTAAAYKKKVQNELRTILDDDDLSDEERHERIIKVTGAGQAKQMDDILAESEAEGSPLAEQVISGSRGNKMNLASLRGQDLLYADHRDRTIPVPVLSSYSEGLRPFEYWAGAYGARKGVIDTKMATARAGYMGKILNRLAHRLVVVGNDAEDAADDGDLRGYPTTTDDSDNEGSLLASAAGPYKRNTPLTGKILEDLRRRRITDILVRSPTVGGPADGGVYARDVGVREKGVLPGIGEPVGFTAAQAVNEPILQAQLCLAGGTLVRMADWSVKPIEGIQPGERVLGADKTGRTFPVQVLHRYDNGLRPCVKTEFGVGQSRQRIELLSTPDHKLLATVSKYPYSKEDYELGVFPVGYKTRDYSAIMTQSAAFHAGPFAYSDDICPFVLGVLLGDGCYTEGVGSVHLSCFDPSLAAYLSASVWLRLNNLKLTKLAGHEGYYMFSQIEDRAGHGANGQFLPGTRNPLRRWLEIADMWGKYAHEKVIPDLAWRWRTGDVAMLLAGLFVTDGSVYVNAQQTKRGKFYLNYASTSRTMVEQVRDLLDFRFAIHTSKVNQTTSGRKRTLYSVNLTTHVGVRKFARSIGGQLAGIKKLTLTTALAGWKVERDVDHDKYYRKSQVPIGELPTYDIEVEHPDHLFVLANGLIVSNSSKHGGGVAGQTKGVSGFQAINQLIEVPSSFQGATHATADGAVSKIEEAPAGGHFVWVGGEQHYVPHGVGLKVKVGDDVEAGDSLSEGAANPETVTMYKGHGEGRRSFTNSIVAAFKSAGIRAHRRNVELLARGLIDHVKLTEPVGDNLPDDIVPYTTFANSYQPREDAARKPHRSALGQFLESPVLHYTIGTKIRPSVVKELERFGVKDVLVHKDPPPFEPVMLRGSTVVSHDPDWQTRMYGSGQKASLLDAAHRGSTSDPAGTSFVPSLAEGTQFGRSTHKVKAPEPGLPLPPEGKPFTDEDDMKHRPKALNISAPAQPTQAFSRLGAMFKFSLDEMASRKEAAEILAKLADAVPQTPTLRPAVSTPQPPRPPQVAAAPTLKPLAAAGQHIKSVMPAKPMQPSQPESSPTTIGQTPFGRNPQMAGQVIGGMHQLGQHFGMGDFGAMMGIGSMLDPAALGALTRGPDRNSLRPQPPQPQPQPQPQPPQASAPPAPTPPALPAAPEYIPVDQEMWAEGARHGMNAFESMYDWAGRPVLRPMASPEQLFSGNWTFNPFRQTR